MIKLIASDVDGTLVPTGAKGMDPSVFDMIEACHAAGIHFVIASGRPYPTLRKTFAPVQDKVIFAADTGALVVRLEQVLYQSRIEPVLGKSIMEDIQARRQCEFLASAGPDKIIAQPKNFIFRLLLRRHMKGALRTVRHLDEITEEYQKISVYVRGGDERGLVPELKRKWESDILVMSAGGGWVDFCHGGKGAALQEIMEQLHIGADEVMVFGDSENDMGMMQAAGHAYAMESAAPEAKAVCGHICGSVREVVASLL